MTNAALRSLLGTGATHGCLMRTQLQERHAELDAAVFAAYGWDDNPATMPEDVVLALLLELNLGRDGV